ncbi:hypothetical protein [Roseovarius sp. MMSF_3359]|uniref:tetratricopeptide repeat protein n=2 Tax=unclassified Roseovarius TaxID=2614913 RepID=UPI00273EA1EC|nr:hypothetical protein [Roseovarius sp. MMSF_3359]
MPAKLTSIMDRQVIEEQLNRVLGSPHFSETTRMKRFLSHVVNEALAGRSDALKGYALGVDVFDKPDDFDPTLDTIVRVQANKLRSRLDLYYGQEGRADPVRILIPKGSYAPVFELAFDPDAADATTPADPPDPRTSLAVMPFDNLSGDPGQEYLADGLTEEIIAALSRFREIRVLSRHVTYRYRGAGRDPREVGADLNVTYLVEGSIRHWDENLRVTAQLIKAATGEQILSDAYDRDLSALSLFEVQEDIAAHVAAEIAEPHGFIHRTGPRPRDAETQALDAYQCRLLATEYWREPSADHHRHVRDLLERATKIDPNYAGAWGMLAIIYGDEVRGGYNYRKDPPPFERALAAAERSVAIDPLNATGLHALFLTRFHLGDFTGFEAAADMAIRANPNYPDMLADLSICCAMRGDLTAARSHIERAVTLCPDPPGWYHASTCVIAFMDGNFEEALRSAQQIGQAYWNGAELFELMCLGQLGRGAEASAIAAAFRDRVPDIDKYLSTIFAIWQVPAGLAGQIREGLHRCGVRSESRDTVAIR